MLEPPNGGVGLRVVVVTVGASLLSNYCARRGIQQASLLESGRAAEELVGYINSGSGADWLYRACAETNTLERILKQGDSIIFIHSETEEGRICAEALKAFYSGRGYWADTKVVKDLKYDERRFSIIGLHSLINMLIEIFESERRSGNDVVLAATGGFKAEMAYATVASLLYGVEVYYIHERFNDVISLPAIPIFFNPDIWIKHEKNIEEIAQAPKTKEELEEMFGKEDLKYFWALLDVAGEGRYRLSPVGWLIYRVFIQNKTRKVSLALRKDYYVEVAGGHGNIWGIRGERVSLSSIRDEDARRLLKRLLSISGVNKVRLGRFNTRRSKETFLKHQSTSGSVVRYELHSKDGIQELEVIAESTEAAETIEELIGSKAYP